MRYRDRLYLHDLIVINKAMYKACEIVKPEISITAEGAYARPTKRLVSSVPDMEVDKVLDTMLLGLLVRVN